MCCTFYFKKKIAMSTISPGPATESKCMTYAGVTFYSMVHGHY